MSRPEEQQTCSRSHPHEEMSLACELRTEIARLRNEMVGKDRLIEKLQAQREESPCEC